MSYELGMKSEWFDRRLRLNVGAFYNTYDDQQVSQPVLNPNGTFGQIVSNVGKTSYRGLEVEATAVPVDGLTLSGSLGLLDIDIKEFGGPGGDIADIAKPQNAPSTTANLSAEYSYKLPSGSSITARTDWNYRSKIYFFATPVGLPFFDQVKGQGRALLDAQLRWDDIQLGNGAKIGVSAFVKNITDKEYFTRAIDFGALGYAGVWYGDPRTYGLELTVRY